MRDLQFQLSRVDPGINIPARAGGMQSARAALQAKRHSAQCLLQDLGTMGER